MRSFLSLAGLAAILMIGSTEASAQALRTDILLSVIILLLFYDLFRIQDFYVVEHFAYDLNFIESQGSFGKSTMRVERGAMFGGRSASFSEYAAAKASFDYQEDLHSGDPMQGTEAIHRVYVVSALRKPGDVKLLKDDKYRGTLLHYSPHQIMYARRKEAKEDRLLGIENERAMAKMRG